MKQIISRQKFVYKEELIKLTEKYEINDFLDIK